MLFRIWISKLKAKSQTRIGSKTPLPEVRLKVETETEKLTLRRGSHTN